MDIVKWITVTNTLAYCKNIYCTGTMIQAHVFITVSYFQTSLTLDIIKWIIRDKHGSLLQEHSLREHSEISFNVYHCQPFPH